MTNKKTIILGVFVIVILAGIFWYTSRNQGQIDSQTASILKGDQGQTSESAVILKEVTEEFVLGNPEAPVTIIEYSSHFCGHCINFHRDTLPLLMDKYIKTGKVKLISRFVSPLELDMAIFCAQEEGRFLEMSEYFFEHAREIKSGEDVKLVAGQLGLNRESFNQCYDSKKYEDKAKEWFSQATESGVKGTPTFFINGQEIVGNQPFVIFEQAIEQALGTKGELDE
jgi:protein-disulfide isomerase